MSISKALQGRVDKYLNKLVNSTDFGITTNKDLLDRRFEGRTPTTRTRKDTKYFEKIKKTSFGYPTGNMETNVGYTWLAKRLFLEPDSDMLSKYYKELQASTKQKVDVLLEQHKEKSLESVYECLDSQGVHKYIIGKFDYNYLIQKQNGDSNR